MGSLFTAGAYCTSYQCITLANQRVVGVVVAMLHAVLHACVNDVLFCRAVACVLDVHEPNRGRVNTTPRIYLYIL